MSEGNANVKAHTPGNEAFSSAGETQLRDSSATAAEEKQREEVEGGKGRADVAWLGAGGEERGGRKRRRRGQAGGGPY